MATIIGTLLVMGTGQDPVATALMALSVVTLAAAIMLRRSYAIVEPLTAVFVLLVLGTPAKLFYIAVLLQQHDRRVYERILLGGDMIALTAGSALIFTAMLALSIGYVMPSGRLKMDRLLLAARVHWSWQRVSAASVILLILSVLGFITFIVTGQISITGVEDLSVKRFNNIEGGLWARTSTLPYYAYRLAGFARFAFYLNLVGLLTGRYRLRSLNGVLLGLSAVIAVFVPFFINNRGGVALVAADAAILTVLLKGRLPFGRSVALGAAAVALILAIASFRYTGGQLDALWSFFGQRHFIEPAKTTFIADAVPDRMPFMLGSSLVSWVLTPVPRTLWPDKPATNELGHIVSSMIYELPTSGVPPGLVAELYMNFGWPGVAIGSLLMGLVLRIAYVTVRPWLMTPTSALLYMMFLTRFTIFAFNNNLGTGIMKFLVDAVPLAMILLFVTSKGRRPNAKPTAPPRAGGSSPIPAIS